ncbi:MAG: glycosyltransferase N-terminal domain-containing protein [bacterium]
MKSYWYIFYNYLIIPLIYIYFRVLGLFNSKVRKGIKDRKKLFENLIIGLTGLDRSKKMVWFHSASMGEFEQAKPIIEQLQVDNDINIVVTFFSPSGYENSRNYRQADIVSYLPLDTPMLVNRFLNLVKPNLAVFMRYDIWPNYIWKLHSRSIPIFLVDATMRKNSKRKWFVARDFHNSLFKSFTRILCVSDDDVANFKHFNVAADKIKAVGDTRFDRVYQKSRIAKERSLFKEGFFGDKKVFVLGSSWENDEDVMLPALLKLMKYDKDLILIIVPHEPTIIHLEKLENILYKKFSSIRFSFLNNYNDERIIVIDSIGILLTLYSYANAAYIGGSFKQGIHNVLEPAVYGIPVIFGPRIENSQEANVLVSKGGGFKINNKIEAYKILRKLLSNENFRNEAGRICSAYVEKNIGATESIVKEINEILI